MFNLIPYSRRGGISRRNNWSTGVDRFFDEFFKDPFFDKVSSIAAPIKADVKETEKEYIIEAELPGVNKEDIIVDLQDNVLTLGVDLKQEKDEEDDGYIYKERQTSSCRRSFTVHNIDNENVKASYKDGILSIVLSKVEPETKNRKIEIE